MNASVRSTGLTNGTYGSGDGSPSLATPTTSDHTSIQATSGATPTVRYARRCTPIGHVVPRARRHTAAIASAGATPHGTLCHAAPDVYCTAVQAISSAATSATSHSHAPCSAPAAAEPGAQA